MNLKAYATIALTTTIFFSSIAAVKAISEDQTWLCKEQFWLNNTQLKKQVSCFMVNDDNLFNQSQKELIDTNFIHELDTFDAIYLSEVD